MAKSGVGGWYTLETQDKKMNLLVVTSTFPRWQNDREPPFVFELCRRLKEYYHIHVLAPHASGSAIEEDLCGIHVKRFRYFFPRWESLAYQGGILERLKQNPLRYGLVPFFLMIQFFALVRILRTRKIDLIHAHWIFPQGLAVSLARLFVNPKPPFLCTSHGGDLYGLQGHFFRLVKRYVLKRATVVTVVSRAMRDEILRLVNQNIPLHVIPMGVDLQNCFLLHKARERTGSLLFVGRLIEQKGIRYLIEAIPLILQQHPYVTLSIIGAGPEEERLRNQVLKLGIADRVQFLGAVANETLPVLYQASDVVVFPSVTSEGFGLVLVEALGCECAVVATDHHAIKDIIIDGKTGLIVSQRDPKQIAEKIVYLLDNPGLGKSLGKEGRRYVLERYDWSLIVGQYVALIESVIDHRSSNASNRP